VSASRILRARGVERVGLRWSVRASCRAKCANATQARSQLVATSLARSFARSFARLAAAAFACRNAQDRARPSTTSALDRIEHSLGDGPRGGDGNRCPRRACRTRSRTRSAPAVRCLQGLLDRGPLRADRGRTSREPAPVVQPGIRPGRACRTSDEPRRPRRRTATQGPDRRSIAASARRVDRGARRCVPKRTRHRVPRRLGAAAPVSPGWRSLGGRHPWIPAS
jgi:hypothetical protein